MIVVLYGIVCLFFIVLQALFAGSEIAFLSSNPLKLRHRIRRGDKKAERAFKMFSSPERFLATTLVGMNISLVISSSLATLLLIHFNVPHSNLWITCLFAPFIVVFAELAPKNLARFYRESFAGEVSGLVVIFERIFAPVVSGIERLSKMLIRLLTGRQPRRSMFVTKEEIKSIVRESESQGILDRGEKEAIEDIFDFRQTKIKDVLTPVQQVVGLDYTDSHAAVLKKIRRYRLTRYPVFRNREVIGFINAFDLFYKKGDWLTLIRPITRVGESQKLYDVFTNLKTKKENIALVMRGKRSLGIVTLEDMMREIVTSIVKTTPPKQNDTPA